MMNRNYNGLKNSLAHVSIIALATVFASYFVSCASSEIADSKDVNQAKIHFSYTVSYDASAGDFYSVTTQFRFGGNKGTTLRLSSPSKVLVNDTEMEEQSDSFSGCYYESTVSGTNAVTVKFTDTENKEYVNSVTVNSVKAKKVDMIDADKKTMIAWDGKPLEANEVMWITIEDNEGNTAVASTDIVGSKYLVITPEDMQSLVAGSAQYYLSRKYENVLKSAADEGGAWYVDYKSENIPVDLKKKPAPKTEEPKTE